MGTIARVTRVDHWVQWPLTRETQTAALHHCRPRLQILSPCKALSDNTDKPRATSSIQIWYDIFLHHNISILIHQRFINPWHDVCLRCLVGFNQFTSLRQTINKIWPKEYHSLTYVREIAEWMDSMFMLGSRLSKASGMSGSWMMLQSKIQISQLLPHFAISTPRMTRSWMKFSKLFQCSGKLTFRILSGNVLLPRDPVVLWVSVFAPVDGDWI